MKEVPPSHVSEPVKGSEYLNPTEGVVFLLEIRGSSVNLVSVFGNKYEFVHPKHYFLWGYMFLYPYSRWRNTHHECIRPIDLEEDADRDADKNKQDLARIRPPTVLHLSDATLNAWASILSFSTVRPLTYSEGISVPKMANTVALHTQLASIMEVLANAAVAEICELVDNGYAVLHLEISRGQKENEALRRKLRLMDLKVSRGSTPRAGMGSSILAHSGARAHLGMESRRTSSCDIQCLRAVDSQLVTSQFGEGKSSGDAGHTTTQRKPAAFDDIKPKSPTIKEERREDAWDSHDQRERQSTEALNHVDGGEMHSAIDTEAAQPISKQENASSCIWVSGETDNCSLLPESIKNLSVNKISQNPGLGNGDGIPDHVGFDCMLFEPPRQLGTFSTQGHGTDLPDCSYSRVDVVPIHSDSENSLPYVMNKPSRSITEQKQPVGYRDNGQMASLPSDEPHMTVRKGMDTGSNALLMKDGWVTHDRHNNNAASYTTDCTAGKLFICSFCSKTLACLQTLKTHLRVHTGEKPFSCMQCGKCFSDSSNFKRHQSVHTGERRYGCSHCGKRFAQSGSLKDHLKVHTGCKQFRCPQCGKTFISANHLKRHIIVHNGERLLPTTFQ